MCIVGVWQVGVQCLSGIKKINPLLIFFSYLSPFHRMFIRHFESVLALDGVTSPALSE